MFHRFHTEVGRQPKQCLLDITTQTASVQVRSFSATILVSTNRDLRLTLDDAGIHYCPRSFWERTRYLGRFLELQRCGILPKVCVTRPQVLHVLMEGQDSKQTWRNAHPRVLAEALSVKTVSESQKRRAGIGHALGNTGYSKL